MNPSLTFKHREMQTMNNEITHLPGPCAVLVPIFFTVKFAGTDVCPFSHPFIIISLMSFVVKLSMTEMINQAQMKDLFEASEIP